MLDFTCLQCNLTVICHQYILNNFLKPFSKFYYDWSVVTTKHGTPHISPPSRAFIPPYPPEQFRHPVSAAAQRHAL